MNNAATTESANFPEPATSEQLPQQVQVDKTSFSGVQAQQSQTDSSDQRPVPGRKPLFRR
jgi:hypothetical protein